MKRDKLKRNQHRLQDIFWKLFWFSATVHSIFLSAHTHALSYTRHESCKRNISLRQAETANRNINLALLELSIICDLQENLTEFFLTVKMTSAQVVETSHQQHCFSELLSAR